jgi:hypothetical protein
MPFLPLLQIYLERFVEGTQSRDSSFFLEQPIKLVPKHITFLTQEYQHFLSTVASKTTVTSSFDLGFHFRMTGRSYGPNLERLFRTTLPV